MSYAYPKECIDLLVGRENPGDKSERAKACPYVIWEPECYKGKSRDISEKSIASDSPTICRFTTFWLMKRSEENC